ncbi:protein-binding protein [Moniliophthora roreri]|nr:protein-binding protein [Moniliophthora roreri]
MSLRYLTAKIAQQIDEELMSSAGAFSIDQVCPSYSFQTESVKVVPESSWNLPDFHVHKPLLDATTKGGIHEYLYVVDQATKVTAGGDGLVAARHLAMFGYKPVIYMPKPGSKDIYRRLKKQCDNMHIPTIPPSSTSTSELENALKTTDVILDAIFGFSFKPPIRAPFDNVLPLLTASKLPIVSVDIPSGWDVEKGNDMGVGLNPDILLSLTAPKKGAEAFKGRHFLGGRFVPKSLEEKFELNLPPYPGTDQIVELPKSAEQEKL